jgi:hypothetical protein
MKNKKKKLTAADYAEIDNKLNEALPDSLFENLPENGKERCVLCGNKTPVAVNTHIDNRLYYVEGCGQLCKYCFEKTYNIHERQRRNYE